MDIYAILLGIFLIGSMCWAAYLINKASKEGIAKSGDPKPIRPRTGFDPPEEVRKCDCCGVEQFLGENARDFYLCYIGEEKLASYDIQQLAFADFHRQIGILQQHLVKYSQESPDYLTPVNEIMNASVDLSRYLKEAQIGL